MEQRVAQSTLKTLVMFSSLLWLCAETVGENGRTAGTTVVRDYCPYGAHHQEGRCRLE